MYKQDTAGKVLVECGSRIGSYEVPSSVLCPVVGLVVNPLSMDGVLASSRWCTLRCLFRWSILINLFAQRSHSNSFSPVWIRSWRFRSSDRVNALVQGVYWQRKGFSFRCAGMCAVIWLVFENTLPNSIQRWEVFPVCCCLSMQLGHVQRFLFLDEDVAAPRDSWSCSLISGRMRPMGWPLGVSCKMVDICGATSAAFVESNSRHSGS